MNNALKLRELLKRDGMLVAAGCYDGISAKMVKRVGFEVAYLTGFGSSASVLGKPDYGLMSMSEMVNHSKNIASAIDIPVVADADTGYGNYINVIRTVQEFEKAGIAAIHLEDQIFPKKCGHMKGKQVIPMNEHVQKIRAAVDSRTDLLIIARTDSLAPLGLDEAIKRSLAYYEAGADMIFIDAPESEEELRIIANKVKAPLLINISEGAKTPLLSNNELEKLGYKMVIYPISALLAGVKAMELVLNELKVSGSTKNALHLMETFNGFNEIIGLQDVLALEKKYNK